MTVRIALTAQLSADGINEVVRAAARVVNPGPELETAA